MKLLLLLVFSDFFCSLAQSQRKLLIKNKSLRKIEVGWTAHPFSWNDEKEISSSKNLEDKVKWMSVIEKNDHLWLDSHVGHSFIIRQASNEFIGRIIVTEDESQSFVVQPDLSLLYNETILLEAKHNKILEEDDDVDEYDDEEYYDEEYDDDEYDDEEYYEKYAPPPPHEEEEEVDPYPYSDPWMVLPGSSERMVLLVNEFEEDVTVYFKTNYVIIPADSSQYIILKIGEEIVATPPGIDFRVSSNFHQSFFFRPLSISRSIINHSFEANITENEFKKIVKAESSVLLSSENCPRDLPLTSLLECVTSLVSEHMYSYSRRKLQQDEVHAQLSETWENYTCYDFNLESSPPLSTTSWTYSKMNITYPVKLLHSLPSSQVHMIENFATAEECFAIEEATKSSLVFASTEGDEEGGRSKYRKALQSFVNIPWEHESEGYPLATLGRRVLSYVNHATEYDLDIFGQEALMFIKYKGSGDVHDPEPDQYMPHCDGSCDGTSHQKTGRVATMLMYCSVAEVGGATNFHYSGLHIVPKLHSAVFFSYLNSHTMEMDNGFTTHSGCPVIKGEKKLITQWLRHGVDIDHHSDNYSASGTSTADEYEYEEEEEEVGEQCYIPIKKYDWAKDSQCITPILTN